MYMYIDMVWPVAGGNWWLPESFVGDNISTHLLLQICIILHAGKVFYVTHILHDDLIESSYVLRSDDFLSLTCRLAYILWYNMTHSGEEMYVCMYDKEMYVCMYDEEMYVCMYDEEWYGAGLPSRPLYMSTMIKFLRIVFFNLMYCR